MKHTHQSYHQFSPPLRLGNNFLKIALMSLAWIACNPSNCVAQTLSPMVISSAGAYFNAGGNSLSSTFGEAITATLTNGNNVLTQGFQQPYKMTLNVKAYLQGYYQNTGYMQNVLFNEGVYASPGNETDTVTIQLRQSSAPYNLIAERKEIIHTDGTVSFNGTAPGGQACYIVLKHRNSVETWSALPVMLLEDTFYDFSTNDYKAFGANQVEMMPGVWALYAGDITGDENVDLLDLNEAEADINLFVFGYYDTDINGDGNVDLLDSPILEANINNFVFSYHP